MQLVRGVCAQTARRIVQRAFKILTAYALSHYSNCSSLSLRRMLALWCFTLGVPMTVWLGAAAPLFGAYATGSSQKVFFK